MAAAAVRLTTWWEVFGPDHIRFMADTDAHYHALRAMRIVQDFPHIPWTDPAMNYPLGAVILWPPLFDLLIAIPAKLAGGSPQAVELAAVWLPPVLGVLTLVLVGALGKAFGERQIGLTAAAVVALLPANLEFTLLGRADQHALELVASCWIFLAFLFSWRNGTTWTRATNLGFATVTAFWNWQGSGFYLVLLLGFVALWHLLGLGTKKTQHPARALAQGATVGGLVLGLSVWLFTPEGFQAMHIMGVTGFHVVLVGLTAAFAWILAALPLQASPWRRLVEIGVSGLVPLVVALTLIPGFDESVKRGLTALTAGNAWYAAIREFAPLLFHGVKPLNVELAALFHHFGLLLFVAPLCALALVKRLREQADRQPELYFLFYWGAVLFVLTFLRVRFNLYAVIPLALWLAIGLQELSRLLARRKTVRASRAAFYVPVLLAILIILPTTSFLVPGTFDESPQVKMSLPLLRWLRGQQAPASDQEGVLAPWAFGHAIQYYARKPVLTTPFGTDGGAGAMEDSASFFLASNPEGAEFLLKRRQIGFVLLSNPADEVYTLYPLSGVAAPSPIRFVPDRLKGATLVVGRAFRSLIVSRLYLQDGAAEARFELPALGGYRLLYEMPPSHGSSSLAQSQIKLFGVVPGATVLIEHAQPNSTVMATVPVVTNQNRAFTWTAVARSDSKGRATVRIPYATGENGAVRAYDCILRDSKRSTTISLSESDVTTGARIVVDLLANAPVSPAAGVRNRT